ncbi:MAG: hypothetical protein ACLFUJ_09220 [Phycisphaerae bacterium]
MSETPKATSSLSWELIEAFAYPWKGNGPFLLLGMLVLCLFAFLSPMILATQIIVYILGTMLAGYLSIVVGHSARHEPSPPGWSDLQTIWDDMLIPSAVILATIFLCQGPAILIRHSHGPGLAYWFVSQVGWFVFPMALLSSLLEPSATGLNPMRILRGIRITLPGYLLAVAIFDAAWLLTVAIVEWLEVNPYLFLILLWPVLMYFAMVAGRVTGLLYWHKRYELGWFDWQDDRRAGFGQDQDSNTA